MRYARLIALALAVAALLACVGLAAGGAPLIGLVVGATGIALGALAALRPVSRGARRRLVLAFPFYALVMVVAALGAMVSVAPAASAALLILAGLGLLAWLFARRQSAERQKALMYMSYIRD